MGNSCLTGNFAFLSKRGNRYEALPQQLRWTVQRAIFHLLDELHLPADGVTIWYMVTPHDGNEVISIQHVRADT